MDGDFFSTIISSITQYISIPFVISANLLTYLAIKGGETLDKHKVFTTTEKRIVTAIITLILLVLFYFFKVSNLEVIFLSAVISPFSYSFVIKKLLNFLGVDVYRTCDTTLVNSEPVSPSANTETILN